MATFKKEPIPITSINYTTNYTKSQYTFAIYILSIIAIYQFNTINSNIM